MIKLDKVKDAKRRARKIQRLREVIAAGLKQTQRVIPDKRDKPPKHKKPIGGYYDVCGED